MTLVLPLYKYTSIRTLRLSVIRTLPRLVVKVLYIKTSLLRINISLNALKEYIFH
jgi:hypothetical protein